MVKLLFYAKYICYWHLVRFPHWGCSLLCFPGVCVLVTWENLVIKLVVLLVLNYKASLSLHVYTVLVREGILFQKSFIQAYRPINLIKPHKYWELLPDSI
jgi:hypothetical protein